MTIDDRGWTSDEFELNRLRVLLWAAENQGTSLSALLAERPDLRGSIEPLASALENEELVTLEVVFGGPDNWSFFVTGAGGSKVASLIGRRGNNRERRTACREAILDWLDNALAGGDDFPNSSQFYQDVRAHFCGDPFSDTEVVMALSDLERDGFLTGQAYASGNMQHMGLTTAGEEVVSHYESSLVDYQRASRQQSGSSYVQNFNAPVYGQVAFGERVSQVQNNGLDPNQLGDLFAAVLDAASELSAFDRESAEGYVGTLRSEVAEVEPDLGIIEKTVGRLQSIAAKAGNAAFSGTVGALAKQILEGFGVIGS